MNKIEIVQECYRTLQKIFGDDQVTLCSFGQIRINCPVCASDKRALVLDVFQDKINCNRCGFKANPIILFIDAYSESPTGDFLESENDVTPVSQNSIATSKMPEIIRKKTWL